MNKLIDKAFRTAISEGVFPAADVLVVKKGEILHSEKYGDARAHTCFDIASLTKPFSTATLTMMAVAEKILKLDDTVYQWLAGAREPHHKKMTVRTLLNHTSGLPAWQPYYRQLPQSMIGTEAGKRIILDECFNEPLLAVPGEKTIYSDLGYILLGKIIEEAFGKTLDTLFSEKIAKPLGLHDTFFVRLLHTAQSTTMRHTDTKPDQHVPSPKHGTPSERPRRGDAEHWRFAPTEDCPWREKVIHGEVHDQNAFALGGVAGHAGLFSTAEDINKFVCELVKSYNGKSDFIPTDVVREFLMVGETKPSGEEFVLGWNRPSRRNSASGQYFSANSIGHLGYTGCSTWIDLNEDFWIILLTNRINPTPMNQKIKYFRPQIHNLIFNELIA